MQILGLLGLGSICHQLFTFIQIGSGHTVIINVDLLGYIPSNFGPCVGNFLMCAAI